MLHLVPMAVGTSGDLAADLRFARERTANEAGHPAVPGRPHEAVLVSLDAVVAFVKKRQRAAALHAISPRARRRHFLAGLLSPKGGRPRLRGPFQRVGVDRVKPRGHLWPLRGLGMDRGKRALTRCRVRGARGGVAAGTARRLALHGENIREHPGALSSPCDVFTSRRFSRRLRASVRELARFDLRLGLADRAGGTGTRQERGSGNARVGPDAGLIIRGRNEVEQRDEESVHARTVTIL